MNYAGPGIRRLYADAVLAADECVHGETGGDLIRPWTGTPHCALCRRRHPVHWREVNPPQPLPANVTPLNGSRKLF